MSTFTEDHIAENNNESDNMNRTMLKERFFSRLEPTVCARRENQKARHEVKIANTIRKTDRSNRFLHSASITIVHKYLVSAYKKCSVALNIEKNQEVQIHEATNN